jgi:hypothetical protein
MDAVAMAGGREENEEALHGGALQV